MKIERISCKPAHQTLEAFADEHGLVMRIGERSDSALPRYWASFPRLERSERGMLVSESGNGDTEIQAMMDYAEKISGKPMVIDAFLSTRRDVFTPILTVAARNQPADA